MTAVDPRSLLGKAMQPYPETWQPEKPGDWVLGTLAQVKHGSTSFGPCLIAELDNATNGSTDKNGEAVQADGDPRPRSVWLLHEAMRSQFRQAAPEIGAHVAVVFLGIEQAKDGKFSYKNFRVTTDRSQTAGASWADLMPATPDAGAVPPADDLPY